MAGYRGEYFPSSSGGVAVSGQDVGKLELRGAAVAVHIHRRHAIQPQENQVHQVLLRERFGLEVGVHESQAAQTPSASPALWQVRDEE